MQSFQKGFGFVVPLIILCLLVGGGGVYWYIGFKNSNSSTTQASNTNEYKPLFAQNEGPGAPNCYYLRGDEVFVSSDGGKNFTIVPGADAKSFKDQSIFGLCFGTDTSHVYRDAQTIAGYNPATFAWLWYTKTKDGPVLFAKKNATSIGKFAFSEGKNTAYTGESVIPNGDPQTFKEWVGSYDFAPWAVDKNNVYCQGEVVLGAIPASLSYSSQNPDKISVTIKGAKKTVDSNCVVR